MRRRGPLAIETGKGRVSYLTLLSNLLTRLVPFMLVAGTLWLTWWYVVIHQQAAPEAVVTGVQQLGTPGLAKGPATAAELGPPDGFYYVVRHHRRDLRAVAAPLLLAARRRPA